MKFEKFEKYIVEENKKGTKHTFHKVNLVELLEIEKKIFIPKELKEFYINIGYGFFYDNPDSFSIDKLYSPLEYCKINLREDYFADDPTLDFYDTNKFENYKIFIEVVEGNYLLIDDNEVEGKNAIIYIDTKIADSLEEFLDRFDKEGHYFE
ncbi:SMI1/KNR4 family protein [Riemerella anatipestifer]|nr:SMI1/KNR4 family protein [Riemerella anatipestifer]